MRAIKTLFATPLTGGVLGFAGMTLAKILGGLLMLKLMAMQLGPDRFGQLGQLMGLVAMVSMLAGGGTTNGLIAMLSGTNDARVRARTWGAALQIYIGVALIVSGLLIVGSEFLSRTLLGRDDLGWIFILLAATQWLVGMSNLLQGLLSVHHKVHLIVRLNIWGIALGTLIFAVLLQHYGFTGAAAGLVLFPAATGVTGCITGLFALRGGARTPDWKDTCATRRQLVSYALVMLVTITAVPLAQLLVRDMVGTGAGWQYAGYWQGVIKISDVYMQFIGMLLIYVALPRFSAQKSATSLRTELHAIRTPLLILSIVGLAATFLLRDWVIYILFSDAFIPTREYFLPQVVGDLLRIASLILVYVALARGDKSVAIAYEITQAVLLVILTKILLANYAGMAPAYAHVLACSGAFLTVMILSRRHATRWFA